MITLDEFVERLCRLGADGASRRFPRNSRDREILMQSVVMQLDSERSYSEQEINAQLKAWSRDVAPSIEIDHVTLRRLLVDYQRLERTADGARLPRRLPRAHRRLRARGLRPRPARDGRGLSRSRRGAPQRTAQAGAPRLREVEQRGREVDDAQRRRRLRDRRDARRAERSAQHLDRRVAHARARRRSASASGAALAYARRAVVDRGVGVARARRARRRAARGVRTGSRDRRPGRPTCAISASSSTAPRGATSTLVACTSACTSAPRGSR